MAHYPLILGAATELEPGTVGLIVVFGALGVAGAVWGWYEQKRRRAVEVRLGAAEARIARQQGGRGGESGDRDSVMFEQHRKMNELTIAKLEAELGMIKAQSRTPEQAKDQFEAGKEYHELMVEKTRLEMDSLRLHILEMRKRGEDWRVDE